MDRRRRATGEASRLGQIAHPERRPFPFELGAAKRLLDARVDFRNVLDVDDVIHVCFYVSRMVLLLECPIRALSHLRQKCQQILFRLGSPLRVVGDGDRIPQDHDRPPGREEVIADWLPPTYSPASSASRSAGRFQRRISKAGWLM